jgi:hypothetical protein
MPYYKPWFIRGFLVGISKKVCVGLLDWMRLASSKATGLDKR